MDIQLTRPLVTETEPAGSDWRVRERADLLAILRREGSATRAELQASSGFSRAVVAQRLAELIEAGLLQEGPVGASTGGRPPKGVRFRAEAGRILAVDLGATGLTAAVTDLAGRILQVSDEPLDIASGPEKVLGRVEEVLGALLEDNPGPVWGIGIGLPGPVEFSTGLPVAPPIMPGWDQYPIRDRMSARFDAPVWVDNDVNVMALGECDRGAAQGVENVVFIKVGTGIGAGLVSHGQLHRGADGSAGDVGHVQVVFDRPPDCRCGNAGCLEAVAGGAALAQTALRLARSGASPMLAALLSERHSLTAAEISEAAQHGDRASIEALQGAGRAIGQMLAAAVNMFNPSLVVIGGGVSGAGDVLMASIREVVYGRSLPLATRHLVIRPSALGNLAGVTGAAVMVLDQLFDHACLARWIEAGSPAHRPGLARA